MILNFKHYPAQHSQEPTTHIVVLHGFLGESGNWHSMCKLLAQKTDVTAFDLRCHGKSQCANKINFSLMAGDVLETITASPANTAAPLVLLGHSMGGKVAIAVAEKTLQTAAPFSMAALIVADIAPRRYNTLLFVENVALLYKFPLQNYRLKSDIEKALAPKINNTAILKFLLKNIHTNSQTGKMEWRIPFNFLYEQRSFLKNEVLPTHPITMPTLFLRGENSNYIGDKDLPLIQKHFSNVKIETIANAGHWVHAENPTGFFTQVQQFLSSNKLC